MSVNLYVAAVSPLNKITFLEEFNSRLEIKTSSLSVFYLHFNDTTSFACGFNVKIKQTFYGIGNRFIISLTMWYFNVDM